MYFESRVALRFMINVMALTSCELFPYRKGQKNRSTFLQEDEDDDEVGLCIITASPQLHLSACRHSQVS